MHTIHMRADDVTDLRGLVLHADGLIDDDEVARIVEERWPLLFAPEVEFEEERAPCR